MCWTLAEMHYVKTHYRVMALADIAARLGRTAMSIKRMAIRLECAENKAPRWREAEKEVLLRHYGNRKPVKDILAMLPGRNRSAVMAMAGKMGLSRPENAWSQAELSCLNHHYPSEGQQILRRLPDKTDEAIRHKARELGLASPGHTLARQWDEKEWLLLRKNRHRSPLDLLAMFPDRSLSSIKNALTRLKRAKGAVALPTVPAGSKPVTTAWHEDEKAILIRWYETSKTMDSILTMLPGRSRSSVFTLARKLGLSRPLSDWTASEIQTLREFYPAEGGAVARRLSGRSAKVVGQKAFQLGIHMANNTLRKPWSAEE
ncbi:hypothetical protein [Cedecea colo]|uniref:Uncharacterized protein n=1 Tax=Cedecea colo TaxID=2552946 RepID=A0ABX0VTW7_9ENTR|nr:hypothetical protein [Cedecea colo]NIY49904.1 hypothetical protein [Cedecea colo]